MRPVSAVIVAAVLGGGSAWAQEESDPYRTAVSVVGGLSVGSSRGFDLPGRRFGPDGRGGEPALVVGGGLARDLSPRLTVEATGLYLDRGRGAWSADAGFRLNLTPSGRSIVPYFAASGGVYSEQSAIIIDADGRSPDRRDRLDLRPDPERRTDGLLTLGGGARFAAGSHVFVRPDVRAQVIFSGDARVRGLFTLNFGYRF